MLLMPGPYILPQRLILQLHFVPYSYRISGFLQQVHNTDKWIVYQRVKLPSQKSGRFGNNRERIQ